LEAPPAAPLPPPPAVAPPPAARRLVAAPAGRPLADGRAAGFPDYNIICDFLHRIKFTSEL